MEMQLDKLEIVTFNKTIPILRKGDVIKILSNYDEKPCGATKYIEFKNDFNKAIDDGYIPKTAFYKTGGSECFSLYPFLYFFKNRDSLKDKNLKKYVKRYSVEIMNELKTMGF